MTTNEPLSIVMYARPTCEDSELARNRMRELEIPFKEVNIDENAEAAQFVEEVNDGFRSTPTLVFGEEAFIIVEPTVGELDQALQRARHHTA